ncbi:MAG: CBS domain-containing protein [Planctomycetes bacterium]|nr:CBS domain-containing protein [Planctomycetota bacterium]
MQTAYEKIPHRPVTLKARMAEDLMSENPISLPREASVQEAIALLADRAFDAAPVIDANGRPIGVVTVTDILVHDREYVRYLKTGDMTPRTDVRAHGQKLPEDFGIEIVDRTKVEEIMTPGIFTVERHLPAAEVVQQMLKLNVHHLFVADSDGTLVGVISTCDILRQLA